LIAKEKSQDGTIEKHRVDLAHGSIIIMGTGCQTHYKHGVPVQKTVLAPRINLTFRVMK
jgi:alkylated DNA repair dioxygenase AlkB